MFLEMRDALRVVRDEGLLLLPRGVRAVRSTPLRAARSMRWIRAGTNAPCGPPTPSSRGRP
eukprot:scaffold15600_cov72-Phaeocystis_antarctica.AAC.1